MQASYTCRKPKDDCFDIDYVYENIFRNVHFICKGFQSFLCFKVQGSASFN